MIPPELEAKILRLYHAEKWRIGTIATQVSVSLSALFDGKRACDVLVG